MDGTVAGPAAASVCPENDGGGGEGRRTLVFPAGAGPDGPLDQLGKAGGWPGPGSCFSSCWPPPPPQWWGLALFQVKGENLLPLWTEPAAQTLYAALPVSGVLGYGLYAAFLYTPEEGGREAGAGSGGAGAVWPCAGPSWSSWGIRPHLTAELESPFFQMAKSVGVEGAFQRVESLVAAVELQRLDPAGGAAPGHEADRGGPPPSR